MLVCNGVILIEVDYLFEEIFLSIFIRCFLISVISLSAFRFTA